MAARRRLEYAPTYATANCLAVTAWYQWRSGRTPRRIQYATFRALRQTRGREKPPIRGMLRWAKWRVGGLPAVMPIGCMGLRAGPAANAPYVFGVLRGGEVSTRTFAKHAGVSSAAHSRMVRPGSPVLRADQGEEEQEEGSGRPPRDSKSLATTVRATGGGGRRFLSRRFWFFSRRCCLFSRRFWFINRSVWLSGRRALVSRLRRVGSELGALAFSPGGRTIVARALRALGTGPLSRFPRSLGGHTHPPDRDARPGTRGAPTTYPSHGGWRPA